MDLRNRLAEEQHRIWARWMMYVFSKGFHHDDGSFTIEAESVKRWTRQAMTHYQDLSDHEQRSDLEIADKLLEIIP